jgi:hypothetical protein
MLDGANGHSATMVEYVLVSSTDRFFWAKFRILATRKMAVIGKKKWAYLGATFFLKMGPYSHI